MTISITLGGLTVTAKNQDVKNLQDAVNEELKLYATKAEVEALTKRIKVLEDRPQASDLTERVEALENMIVRAPAEAPMASEVRERPRRPKGISPNEMTLVYDRATIYYGDMELYADRIGENRWRLYSTMNYIVISPAVWTYDEIVEGTPEEVYAHAQRRLEELAKLKPQHDAVHARVARMSEGAQ